MSYHGYAPTDLYRIDARFGSNEDYRRLVAEARAKGIGVIHDIILNHIGDRHRWLRPEGLPTRDWINPRRLTNHAHIAVLDPHRAQDDLRGMVDGWFVNSMPDLNTRQPLLGEYLIQNTLWWIGTHTGPPACHRCVPQLFPFSERRRQVGSRCRRAEE